MTRLPYSVVKRISSVYSRFELLDYFILLNEELAKANLHNTFYLRFTNLDKQLLLCYNPQTKFWKLASDPYTRFQSPVELVEKVFAEFDGQKQLVLGAVMSCSDKDKISVQKMLNEWQKIKEIIFMHTVTDQKANLRDTNGQRWVNVATHLGEAEKVVDLVDLMWFWNKNPITLGFHGTLSTLGLIAAIALLATGFVPVGILLLAVALVDFTLLPYVLDAADDSRVVNALRHQIFYESVDVQPEQLSTVATILKKSGVTNEDALKKVAEIIKKQRHDNHKQTNESVTVSPKISLTHSAKNDSHQDASAKISLTRR